MLLIKKWRTNSGLEIASDTVANATDIFSLANKNSGLVANGGNQISPKAQR